jgi:hypothetical protein
MAEFGWLPAPKLREYYVDPAVGGGQEAQRVLYLTVVTGQVRARLKGRILRLDQITFNPILVIRYFPHSETLAASSFGDAPVVAILTFTCPAASVLKVTLVDDALPDTNWPATAVSVTGSPPTGLP